MEELCERLMRINCGQSHNRFVRYARPLLAVSQLHAHEKSRRGVLIIFIYICFPQCFDGITAMSERDIFS